MSKRELQKEETRGKILEAACKLFLSKSIGSVSTSEIADEAGVGKGSIFHHFSNKEALVVAVLSECLFQAMIDDFRELAASIKKDPDNYEKHFRKTFTDIFDFEQANPKLMQFVLSFISEYPPDFSDPESPFMAMMLSLKEYMSILVETLAMLGVSNPMMKVMMLFSLLDGMALQFEFMPVSERPPDMIPALIEEVIDIISFWVKQQKR